MTPWLRLLGVVAGAVGYGVLVTLSDAVATPWQRYLLAGAAGALMGLAFLCAVRHAPTEEKPPRRRWTPRAWTALVTSAVAFAVVMALRAHVDGFGPRVALGAAAIGVASVAIYVMGRWIVMDPR